MQRDHSMILHRPKGTGPTRGAGGKEGRRTTRGERQRRHGSAHKDKQSRKSRPKRREQRHTKGRQEEGRQGTGGTDRTHVNTEVKRDRATATHREVTPRKKETRFPTRRRAHSYTPPFARPSVHKQNQTPSFGDGGHQLVRGAHEGPEHRQQRLHTFLLLCARKTHLSKHQKWHALVHVCCGHWTS